MTVRKITFTATCIVTICLSPFRQNIYCAEPLRFQPLNSRLISEDNVRLEVGFPPPSRTPTEFIPGDNSLLDNIAPLILDLEFRSPRQSSDQAALISTESHRNSRKLFFIEFTSGKMIESSKSDHRIKNSNRTVNLGGVTSQDYSYIVNTKYSSTVHDADDLFDVRINGRFSFEWFIDDYISLITNYHLTGNITIRKPSFLKDARDSRKKAVTNHTDDEMNLNLRMSGAKLGIALYF